jgi:hypothetical protein
MKRIINGKTYNTDTAQHVCDLRCSANRGDFRYHDTALYRSPKGQFFLSGEGGAMSMWSQSVGNNGSCGGSGIRLVDESEARSVMEDNRCDADDFAAVGLAVEEG